MKFLKVGRVAIITRGRYAGKKVRSLRQYQYRTAIAFPEFCAVRSRWNWEGGEMNKNTTWCFMSCIPTTISRRRTKEGRHAMLGHDFIFCFRQMETLIADSISLHRLSSSSPLTTATSLTLSATPWLPALSDTPPRSPAACPRPARRSETRSSPSSRSSTTTT